MSIIQELKRRNVFRVAAAYMVVSWLLIQVLEIAAEAFEAPSWVMKMIITILAVGFVPTIFFSWAYEITPEGIKLERDVVRTGSITDSTARKLDYITVAAVLCVVGLFLWQTFAAPITMPAVEATTHSKNAEEQSDNFAARLGGKSIAVMPFADRSNLGDDLYFTDGIHDVLLTQLTRIRDLKVTSRTSVMAYRNTTKNIRQIATELGVAKLLEGSVQRAGDRIRINAQLIDVKSDTHVWAETFDREMTIDNLFEIQSEITRHIVEAIRGRMTHEENMSLATAPTQSIAAYEAYLRAREVLNGDYSMDEYMTAQPLVQKAIELDPDFALAYLLLAEVHGHAAWIGYDDTPQRQRAAYDALSKAQSLLGPQSPALLAARGEYLYRFEGDYPAALNAQLKALVAMPGNALILEQIGLTQRRMGLWEDSVDSFLQGAELDPANASLLTLAADTLLAMQQWSRMRGLLLPARKRFPNDVDLAALEVLVSLRSEGNVQLARQQFNNIRPNSGESYYLIATELPWYERDFSAVIDVWNRPEVLKVSANEGRAGVRELNLAMAYSQLEDTQQANQYLDQVIRDLMELDRGRRAWAVAAELGTLSVALALRGESDKAIQIAEEATRTITTKSDALDGLMPMQSLCHVLALSGERDRALDLLADIIDVPGGLVRWEMYLDPRWDFFRDDRNFNDLIRPHALAR